MKHHFLGVSLFFSNGLAAEFLSPKLRLGRVVSNLEIQNENNLFNMIFNIFKAHYISQRLFIIPMTQRNCKNIKKNVTLFLNKFCANKKDISFNTVSFD